MYFINTLFGCFSDALCFDSVNVRVHAGLPGSRCGHEAHEQDPGDAYRVLGRHGEDVLHEEGVELDDLWDSL